MSRPPPLSTCFYNDLHAVVSRYSGEGLEVCQAVGVLELLKIDLINEQTIDDDDEPGA